MYTALKLNPLLIRGIVRQSAQFTDDVTGDSFSEEYQARAISADWPDSLVRRRLEELNAIDLKQLVEGPVNPSPPEPPIPTQDELDLQAWLAAREDYLAKKKVFESGVSKVITQQHVDDAFALMKTLFKEEYGVFIR